MRRVRPRLAIGTAWALTGLGLVACGSSTTLTTTQEEQTNAQRAYWTLRQAESVAVVRGQPVHVRSCRGLGSPRRADGITRYSRFACAAGTGLDWEAFDTVAVTYVLVPLGRWTGARAPHVLRDVHFVGAGIP